MIFLITDARHDMFTFPPSAGWLLPPGMGLPAVLVVRNLGTAAHGHMVLSAHTG
jgi:hypothetical protein